MVLSLVEAADREIRADPEHESELAGWVSTSAQARLGIPWRAIGPRPDRAGAPVRDFGRHPAAEGPAKSFELLPKLAVLSTPRDQRADRIRAGQGLQPVLLTATVHGLSTSLPYQPIKLHDMHDRPGWWPWPEEPQMVVRYGYGPRASGTNRLQLSEVLAHDSGQQR